MNDRLPPTTNDDKVLSEIRALLDGYPAGTYGPDDAGLPELAPRFTHAKFREALRGGLPSSSVPEAISGSREAPIPVTQPTLSDGRSGPIRLQDAVDDRLLRDRRAYSSLLLTALSQVRMARAIENYWRFPAKAVPDEPVVWCSNCAEPLGKGDARRGENGKPVKCSRCRKHYSRHELDYPNVRTDGKKSDAA